MTVTGVAGEVRADEPQIGDRLDAIEIEETPLPNRKITYLPLLNSANRPAINQGDVFMNEDLFTTNGAGRRQTWFEVDGSTGNDSWGRQTIFSIFRLPQSKKWTCFQTRFRRNTVRVPEASSTSSRRVVEMSFTEKQSLSAALRQQRRN